jgi:hypothetical protein
MLKVASTAPSAMRKLAGRANAITRGTYYFHDIRTIKRRSSAGYLNLNFFTRYRMANKNHCSLVTRYEMTAVGDLLDGDDKALTYG